MVEAHPPRIPLPFALDRNPHAPDAKCRLLDWARRHRLLDRPGAEKRLVGARLGDLAAYTHPDAAPDLLYLYGEFIAWQFLAQDRYADSAEHTAHPGNHAIDQIESVYRTGRAEPAAGAMAHALADILERVYPAMSAEWREHFVVECVATLRRMVRRTPGASPTAAHEHSCDVDAYIRHRRLVGGQFACLLLDEFIAGGELPGAIRDGAAYDDIRNAQADVVTWTSDYYASRDNAGTDSPADLVGVLAYTEHVGREHAEAAVAVRIQDRVADFMTARRALQGRAGDAASVDPETEPLLRRCVSAMHNRMAGTEAWAWENVRGDGRGRGAGRVPTAGGGPHVPEHVADLLDVRGHPRGWDGDAAGHLWP
ncbi:terpene synthase family protein [Embleya scabrispora]|uniref:terpene synthase family protein n=1 Tax=Embleya scabrispora TaxID=159449 RepID=UPI0003810337|nr:hypothetical protein [Embleya scabrispora]MYS87515.1 hypothetical protein [Streptomyces sp. SID5474]